MGSGTCKVPCRVVGGTDQDDRTLSKQPIFGEVTHVLRVVRRLQLDLDPGPTPADRDIRAAGEDSSQFVRGHSAAEGLKTPDLLNIATTPETVRSRVGHSSEKVMPTSPAAS